MTKKQATKILAKTRTIELDPAKKYLFVFDATAAIDKNDIHQLMVFLNDAGIRGVGLAIHSLDGLEVVEQ